MEGLNKLPNGWKWAKLKDTCEVVTGTTPPKSDMTNYGNDIPFFKPPHLWDGLISDTDEKLSIKGSEKARVVPPNTVLVTCIGNLGRTGFVKKNAAFNQQINAILENEKIGGKYIFYQTQSPLFKEQLEKLATGTTVSIVNKGNFETIKIPVPPIQIQENIVSKIEELFSELDNGIANLKTAQQQLKTYRQSVLKWAFEGKLTKMSETGFTGLEDVQDGQDIQDEKGTRMGLVPMTSKDSKKLSKSINLVNPDADNNVARTGIEPVIFKDNKKSSKSINPVNPDADKSELPEGWKWVKFGEIHEIKSNLVDALKYLDSPHIAPDNISKGTAQLLAYNTIREDKVFSPKHKFYKGQIIYSKIRPNLAKVIIAPIDGLCSADMYPIESSLDNKFSLYYMLTSYFVSKASNTESRTILPKINQKGLNEIPFPLCSLEEQQQIVQEIESRLSVADKMEESITASLQQAEALRQSILKKAFEGRLI